MTVYRRGGSYCVSVYEPASKAMRWVGSFPTEEEARAVEADALRPVNCAGYQVRWLKIHPRKAQVTNDAYERRTRPFAERFGDLPLAELEPTTAVAWAITQPWNVWEATRAMLNDAMEDGVHPGPNPFAGIRQRVFTRSHAARSRPSLTRADVFALADEAIRIWGPWGYEVFAPLIITIAHVDLRPLQVCGIRREDVQDGYILLSDESGRALNRIDLVPEARAAIALVPPLDGIPWLFTTKQGRRFNQDSLKWYWLQVRAAAGLHDVCLDTLRFHQADRIRSQRQELAGEGPPHPRR